MAQRILRDHEANRCERSDFPILCHSCLGDNPYLRMALANFDKECKVCTRPFTVVRWRPGRAARYKKTEICQTCSKLKNLCQVCILDLEYGQVRDTTLNITSHDSIPRSNVNREYFVEEHERMTRAGLDCDSSFVKMGPNDTLLNLQRSEPHYEMNQPHVCSFNSIGKCTRGAGCAFRHEMPKTGELSHQNIKDRYYGENDPVAMKLLRKAGETSTLEPPEDESIKTLYIGGLNSGTILEHDIRDQFYAYGEIQSIRILAEKACAFVTYTTRQGAEKAMQELSNRLVINGQRLKLTWGRSHVPKHDQDSWKYQEGSVAQCGLLPPTMQHQYNMHSAPPNQERPYYPSMDPQRMGGLSTNRNNGASYLMPPHQPHTPPPY
ncbi:hypothetical protein F2Q70_00006684 [Brassica cretica]|uniref:Uncharacterized protein n=1 Tax=Brassica cretica TaxID=69181 RepID=A0A8S9G146_BRACR|nr:hypothetical protein F2Q68_00023359 [Brassica cretica]KAF2571133.1 hypothetical protein F2Q70_00006684 [Brassica cretica]